MTERLNTLVRDHSNGWLRVDTRGRLFPGRFAGLLRLLDDSFSLQVPFHVRL